MISFDKHKGHHIYYVQKCETLSVSRDGQRGM